MSTASKLRHCVLRRATELRRMWQNCWSRERVVPELGEDVLRELRAVVGRAAHVRDRLDLAARDAAGLLECAQRDRLAGQERLGAREADDRRRDAAVRNGRGVDVPVGGAEADGGGESGDVEVFAP